MIFGKLTVISRAGKIGSKSIWNCDCLCGGKTVVRISHLNSGQIRTCGCGNKPHGHTSRENGMSKEYAAWLAAKQRCDNPNNKAYHNYGGRGIKMSIEFRESFICFLEHVGTCPDDSLTLDRINNKKGYQRGNLAWRSQHEQARNKRNNRLMTHNGKTMCTTDWAIELNMDVRTLRNRLSKGWSDERTLTEPIKKP